MDSVLRAVSIYVILMVVFRIAGKRSFAEITNFDFVLLIVIGETTQQALLGENFSITNAFILIATLVGIDIALSMVMQKNKHISRIVSDEPVVIVHNGQLLTRAMEKERITKEEILQAARMNNLHRLEDIKYAILELSGGITVIPTEEAKS